MASFQYIKNAREHQTIEKNNNNNLYFILGKVIKYI
jgi:hypothetical protein